jgi:hypothetical protein
MRGDPAGDADPLLAGRLAPAVSDQGLGGGILFLCFCHDSSVNPWVRFSQRTYPMDFTSSGVDRGNLAAHYG